MRENPDLVFRERISARIISLPTDPELGKSLCWENSVFAHEMYAAHLPLNLSRARRVSGFGTVGEGSLPLPPHVPHASPTRLVGGQT